MTVRVLHFDNEVVSSYRLKKCSELVYTCDKFEYYVNLHRGYHTMLYVVDKNWDKLSKGRVSLDRRIHFLTE